MKRNILIALATVALVAWGATAFVDAQIKQTINQCKVNPNTYTVHSNMLYGAPSSIDTEYVCRTLGHVF